MWSDPDDVENWGVSPRGAGWLFGSSVTREVCPPSFLSVPLLSFLRCHMQFNHVNSLSLIARAHQLVQEGYKYMFDEALATVWSAPNYCYRCGNMAAILTVQENGERSFTVYGPAPENERDTAQQRTRRPVRCLFVRCDYLEMLIQYLLKGKSTVFRVGRRMSSHRFQCTLNSFGRASFGGIFHCLVPKA